MVNKKKFKNILVPFDDSKNSQRALDKAIQLATDLNGKLTIIHVISYHKTVAKIVGPYKGRLVDSVNKFLNQAKKNAEKNKVKSSSKILYGNSAEQILKFMQKNKFDLIVLGRRGTSSITGNSLGSVSNALIQNSNVPV
ncbi:MAG: universal stress protein, partial [Nitrosopumilaceae archaeon]|nr:universal stress protein [Nitrosopumilaceae archaeon]NIU88385.1 universal stress protein [Nitrosopumilaceae archaeon]NIV66669.1 universal stress protein [Nitrosopumilaceae archaeon]NIX62572.1 universal stress protein [Nitrosopumilaceae archaeon]